MKLSLAIAFVATIGILPAASSAQAAPSLAGTWEVSAGAKVGNGPRSVVIRTDSSASWGKETVRWRVVKDKIWIAIGGEWEIYKFKLSRNQMKLSGGDLTDEVTLKRVGPPTPRAKGVAVPPDPGIVAPTDN